MRCFVQDLRQFQFAIGIYPLALLHSPSMIPHLVQTQRVLAHSVLTRENQNYAHLISDESPLQFYAQH